MEVERKIMLLALFRLMSETELESRLLLQLITFSNDHTRKGGGLII